MKKILSLILLWPTILQAGEIDWNFSGQINALYGYTDYSSPKLGHPNNNHAPIYGEVNSSVSYSFDEETQVSLHLDLNGGIDRNMADYNQGDWGEENYVISDSFLGRFMIGQTYNAAYQFHVGAPQAGLLTSNNNFVTDFINNPNWQRDKDKTIYKSLNSTAINTDGVAPKLTYISPENYGTILGFSYIPEIYNRRGLISKSLDYKDDSGYVASIYNQSELGYYTLESSISYAFYDNIDTELSAGLKISRGGWSLGGSIHNTQKEGDTKIREVDGFRDSFSWDVGVGYEIGPFSTSISYFSSKSDEFFAQNEIVSFSNQYELSNNLTIYMAAEYADFESEDEHIKGYAIISGIGFSF